MWFYYGGSFSSSRVLRSKHSSLVMSQFAAKKKFHVVLHSFLMLFAPMVFFLENSSFQILSTKAETKIISIKMQFKMVESVFYRVDTIVALLQQLMSTRSVWCKEHKTYVLCLWCILRCILNLMSKWIKFDSLLIFLVKSSSMLFLMFTVIKMKLMPMGKYFCWDARFHLLMCMISCRAWISSREVWFLARHEYLPAMHKFLQGMNIFSWWIIFYEAWISSCNAWILTRNSWVLTRDAWSSAMH